MAPLSVPHSIASRAQVKEGDEIAPGDILCDVETDKATMVRHSFTRFCGQVSCNLTLYLHVLPVVSTAE